MISHRLYIYIKDILLRDTSTLSKEEPGVEIAAFQLPVNPLYLLSYSHPNCLKVTINGHLHSHGGKPIPAAIAVVGYSLSVGQNVDDMGCLWWDTTMGHHHVSSNITPAKKACNNQSGEQCLSICLLQYVYVCTRLFVTEAATVKSQTAEYKRS